MSSWARGAAFIGAVGTVPVACASEYDAPPTRCDYFCAATQRADCPDDDPVDCVGDCERELSGRFADCEPAFETLIECYQAAPDVLFSCRGDESRTDTCRDQLLGLEVCAADTRDTCRQWCDDLLLVCPPLALSDCYTLCRYLPEACPAQGVVYVQCRANNANCEPLIEDPACSSERNDWEQCLGFRTL